MPCSSHLTSWPLASAAVCAAVGFGFSAGSAAVLPELPELEFESDELVLPSLLLRLHAATTITIKAIAVSCFIGLPTLSARFQKHTPFTLTADASQHL